MFLRNILHKGKARLAAIATILMAVALPVVYIGSASADSFCNYNGSNGDGYCLITQGGTVNSCNESIGSCYSPNFDWSFLNAGGGFSEISSDNYGECIGDYGNSSSNASAGLDECPTQGNAGWGTKWYYGYCTNGLGSGYIFENYHWSGGWLGPQNWNNGAKEYLNKPSAWCFADDPYV